MYRLPQSFAVDSKQSYHGILHYCVQTNPYLSTIIRNGDADKAYFEHAPSVNLEQRIDILPATDTATGSESTSISCLVTSNLDRPFAVDEPRWRFSVLLLASDRCFICFSYSHIIGDGSAGRNFHASLLTAIRSSRHAPAGASIVSASPGQSFPPAFDTPKNITISWPYLLRPLLGSILPDKVAVKWGLTASAASSDAGTWTGRPTPPTLADAQPCSGLAIFEIPADHIASVITLARRHDAKLTSVVQQILVEAFGAALGQRGLSSGVTDMLIRTDISLRPAAGLPDTEPGNCVSEMMSKVPLPTAVGTVPIDWAAAKATTVALARAASTTKDQIVGLLRYVPNMRKWIVERLGTVRECSFEVSNIGNFQDTTPGDNGVVLESMLFAQPGQVTEAPISFNLVGVKDGPLVGTATWHKGSLLEARGDEGGFVDDICAHVKRRFGQLASEAA